MADSDRMERVYISVETGGIDAAINEINKIKGPLQDLFSGKLTVQTASTAGKAATELAVAAGKAAVGVSGAVAETMVRSAPAIMKAFGKELTPFVKDLTGVAIGEIRTEFKPVEDKVSKFLADAAHVAEVVGGAVKGIGTLGGFSKVAAPAFFFLKSYTLLSRAANAGLKPAQQLLEIQGKITSEIAKQVKETGIAKTKIGEIKESLQLLKEDINAEDGNNFLQKTMNYYRNQRELYLQEQENAARSAEGFFSKISDKLWKAGTGKQPITPMEILRSNVAVFLDQMQYAWEIGIKDHPMLLKVSNYITNSIADIVKPSETGAFSVIRQSIKDFAGNLLIEVGESIQTQAPTIAKFLDDAGMGIATGQKTKKSSSNFKIPPALLKDLEQIQNWALRGADGVFKLGLNFKQLYQTEGLVAALSGTFSSFVKSILTMPIGELLLPFKLLGKEILSLTAKMLTNPVIAFAAAITALTAAVVGYVKSNEKSLETYEKLNPEAQTYRRNIEAARKETEAMAMAVDSLFGKDWDDLIGNLAYGVGSFLQQIKKTFQEVYLIIFDGTWKERFRAILAEFKLMWAEGVAVMLETFTATLPNRLQKWLGISKLKDGLAEMVYNQRKAIDDLVRKGSLGDKLAEQEKRAKNVIAGKSPAGDKEDKSAANKDEELKIELQIDWQVLDGTIWKNKYLEQIEKLKEEADLKLQALNELDGDEVDKEAVRLDIEKKLADEIKNIRIQNEREIGEATLQTQDLIATQRAAREIAEAEERKRRDQERLAAFQQLQAEMAAAEKRRLDELAQKQKEIDQQHREYVKMFSDNISGTLTSSITSFFDAALEGNADLRESSYQMFMSLAKNIFNMGITKLITYAIEAMMGQYEANSKYGLPGLAIATAASGVLAGVMAGMKSKLSPAKIQYQTGGYISSGMVRGAYSSGDSVEALLQPGERVLSKEETKAYDKGMSYGQQVIFNITVNGQLSTQADVDRFTRQTLVPAFRRAAIAGYKA